MELNCVTWERGALASGVGTAHLGSRLEGKTLSREPYRSPRRMRMVTQEKTPIVKSPACSHGRASTAYTHTV